MYVMIKSTELKVWDIVRWIVNNKVTRLLCVKTVLVNYIEKRKVPHTDVWYVASNEVRAHQENWFVEDILVEFSSPLNAPEKLNWDFFESQEELLKIFTTQTIFYRGLSEK